MNIRIDEERLEQVDRFRYLHVGVLITTDDDDDDDDDEDDDDDDDDDKWLNLQTGRTQ